MNDYNFTDREKAFFQKQNAQLNSVQMAINNAMQLVVEQQGLEGRWQMNQDWTGLIRTDPPTPMPPMDVDSTRIIDVQPEQVTTERLNGAAH